MFLKELQIQVGAKIIRQLFFRKGVNLIVDETPSTDDKRESGNNVGKTTVVRLIDFCLGGSGSNIFKDPEFKDKNNTQIEKYLKDNNVIISLVVTENIGDPNAKEVTITRNFQSHGNKIQEIDGEKYSNTEFERKLSQLFFKTETERPSFRQIIAKNIRDEKQRLVNTIRVLHQTTKVEEYEALYLFWLGVDTNTAHRKQKLIELKNSEERVLNKIKKESSFSEIEQALEVIKRDLEDKNKQKEAFRLNDNYQKDLKKLNEIKNQISKVSSEIGKLSLRKNLIDECEADLKKEFANVNLSSLEKIYKSAKRFLPEMNKKFEDLVSFHNKMVKEKISFITKELPSVEKRLQASIQQQRELTEEGKALSALINKSNSSKEFEKLIIETNNLHEQKGKYEEKHELWKSISDKIDEINKELDELNKGISNKDSIITSKVTEFNKYFSKLSEELYGEKFILSVDKTDRAYEFKISSIGGNLGTGKKKGQIAAFDFAYVQYADENNIPCLHFMMHDQIENVHDNQLYTLENIANRSNCQLILPVLRDKLPVDFDIEKYAVVKLSQNDKLFKVN